MKFDFFSFWFFKCNILSPDTFISSLKFLESFLSFEKNSALFSFYDFISNCIWLFYLLIPRERRVSVDVLSRIFVSNTSFATRFFLFIKRGETVLCEIILNIIISRIINYVILILFMGKLLKKKIILILLFFLFHFWFVWILEFILIILVHNHEFKNLNSLFHIIINFSLNTSTSNIIKTLR